MSLHYKDKAEYKEDSVLLGRPGAGGSSQGAAGRKPEGEAGFLTQLAFFRTHEMRVSRCTIVKVKVN